MDQLQKAGPTITLEWANQSVISHPDVNPHICASTDLPGILDPFTGRMLSHRLRPSHLGFFRAKKTKKSQRIVRETLDELLGNRGGEPGVSM